MSVDTRYRICPFCEATCGLALTVEDGRVTKVRGDEEDAFSEGYLCPKGTAIGDLHEDADRLRSPMIREGATWREATWEEAFGLIQERLPRLIEEHGRSAVGLYLGNPTVHNMSLGLYSRGLIQSLNTPNLYSAATVDQRPMELVSALLFGTGGSIPVPDIDRCDYMVMLGANPLESNGSLMTAPNFPERLRRLKKRGGKLVVLDPRRTKTAQLADQHLAIRPGTDAFFLMAVVHTLFEEGLTNPGRLAEFTSGIEELREVAEPYSPEAVASRCNIDAETIREIARGIASAKSAAVHARMGASTQAFGTLSNWLPQVIHVLTGNLDRPGGAMFALAAHGAANAKGTPGKGKGLRMNRGQSRVRNRPELFGEFPVAGLAEEIDTPGEGQIRAMIVVSGNPVLSTPNSERLQAALASLDFMVSLDIYLNETSRHADVILPGLSPLELPHYDVAFSGISIQNHARFSPRVFEKPKGAMEEWESLLQLSAIVAGAEGPFDTKELDDRYIESMVRRELAFATSSIYGRDAEEVLGMLGSQPGPERVLDFQLRTGPYGDAFGAKPDGLSLERVKEHPHGIPLGAMEPRLPDALRTVSGTIELAPPMLLQDVARLWDALGESADALVLVGRRNLRSNNSWMHNLSKLVSGKNRCTAHIHPDDAKERSVSDGDLIEIQSRVGRVEVEAELTPDILRGVVSLPHGWGHDLPGVELSVASALGGANTNVLTDEEALDVPSGTSVLSGIPIEVSFVGSAERNVEDTVSVPK